MGHTGQVIVTAPAPSQRRVSSHGSSTARGSRLASAGAQRLATNVSAAASPPISARSELPPLPWAAAAQPAAEGGGASSSRPPLPTPLDDLGKDEEPAVALKLTPSSQVKLRSLDSTLDKLQSDRVRESPVSLWQKAHARVSMLNHLTGGEHGAHQDLRGGAGSATGPRPSDATDLGASWGEMNSLDGCSSEPLSMGGNLGSRSAGAELAAERNTGPAADFQPRMAWSGELQDQSPASQQQQQPSSSAGESAAAEAAGAARAQATTASSDKEGNGAGDGTHERTSSRAKTATLANSRGGKRKPSSTRRRASLQDASGEATSSARRPGESKDDEDYDQEVDENVQDDLLDEFLEELFGLYSTARDNKGRPLMDNMGVRRLLQDFCIGPNAKPSAAKVAKIVSQADVLYDNELERQGNMNFMFDLTKGEASRGLAFKAFHVLLRQVNMPSSSKEMSRRWFCKYAPRAGASGAPEVAMAMFEDHGGELRF